MNKLTSNICFGCIGGLYSGLILISLVVYFVIETDFSAKQILGFYGVAMFFGMLGGGIISWFAYRKNDHTDTNCENNHKISNIEKASIYAIILLSLVFVLISLNF